MDEKTKYDYWNAFLDSFEDRIEQRGLREIDQMRIQMLLTRVLIDIADSLSAIAMNTIEK